MSALMFCQKDIDKEVFYSSKLQKNPHIYRCNMYVHEVRIESLNVSPSNMGLCGPICRFVYPDVIKSYFIENVPCSLRNFTFRQ